MESAYETPILEALDDVDIVLLPLRQDDDGIGIYPEGAVTLAKHLRLTHARVAFAHAPESRRWLQLLGHGEVSLIGAIAINLVSSASWDLVRTGLAHWIGTLGEGTRLSIRLDLYSKSGKKREALELQGRASQVLRALNEVPDVVRRIRDDE